MLRHQVIGLLIVLTAGSVTQGADDAQEWLNFLVGKWERKREIQVEGEEKVVETAKWSGKLAADGKAVVSTGKWDNGTKWVMIAGTVPGILHFERGLNSAGLTWSIDYSQVNPTTLKGATTGMVEGKKIEGAITLTKTGDNSYEGERESKNEDGQIVRAKAANTRLNTKSEKKKRQR